MATNTKQKIEEEFNVQEEPQAQTMEDVNSQDSRTRLWQSLQNSADYQKEQTNQAYDQNRSAADRAALQRGMGRSSYNLQTMANIDTERAKALDQIDQNLVSAYQSGLNQLEQQEIENDRWERQFAEGQRQFDTNLDFNRTENALNREQNQSQFDVSLAWQKEQWADQKDQWREQMDYTKKSAEEQKAINLIMNMLETNDKPSDALLKQAGISRKDYEQMKTSAQKATGSTGGRSGTPIWKQLGFNSEADYNKYLFQQNNRDKLGLNGDSGLFSALDNWKNNTTPAETPTTTAYQAPNRGSDVTTTPNGKFAYQYKADDKKKTTRD